MALDGFGHIKIARFLNDNDLCEKSSKKKKYKLSMNAEEEEKYNWSTSQ